MGAVALAAVFRHELLAAQAAKLGAEALRHLLGHGRGSRLIGRKAERHHGAGDTAADLTAAHTAAEAGRDTLCRAFVPAGLFLPICLLIHGMH